MKKTLAVLIASCFTVLALPSFAEMIEATGQGKAPLGTDLGVTRQESFNQAKRDAVEVAVRKVIGNKEHKDPKVQEAIDEITKQLPDSAFYGQKVQKDPVGNVLTTLTLKVDSQEFHKQLQDFGIQKTDARSYPILMVMDEFFTTPSDKTKPLREVIEFSNDQSSSYTESNTQSSSATQIEGSSSEYANGQAEDTEGGAVVAGEKQKDKTAKVTDAATSNENSVQAEQKNIQKFKKLVEYQPQNVGPEKQNYTMAALQREANRFDLNVLDSDLFKSRYFTGKPLTMDEMQNSKELSRFIDAARDQKADFFMVGNSIIYDLGKNPNTGQSQCDGAVTFKTYSTEDGRVLVSTSHGESASGNSPDQCRVNVANKLAYFAGRTMGKDIHNYYKNRNTYGQEYHIYLISLLGKLNANIKDDFSDALEGMTGVQNKLNIRKSNNKQMEVVLTYKGDAPIGKSLRGVMRNVKGLENADRQENGTEIKICVEGECPR